MDGYDVEDVMYGAIMLMMMMKNEVGMVVVFFGGDFLSFPCPKISFHANGLLSLTALFLFLLFLSILSTRRKFYNRCAEFGHVLFAKYAIYQISFRALVHFEFKIDNDRFKLWVEDFFLVSISCDE